MTGQPELVSPSARVKAEVPGWEPTGGEEEEEEEEELAMGNMLYLFIKRVISSLQ